MEKLENKLRLRHKTVEGLVSRLNELSRARDAADSAAVEAVKAELQARLDAAEHAKVAAETQVWPNADSPRERSHAGGSSTSVVGYQCPIFRTRQVEAR
jgi:hypothetical protein